MAEASSVGSCKGDLGVAIELDLECIPEDAETDLDWDFYVPLSARNDLEWDDSAIFPIKSFHFELSDKIDEGLGKIVIWLGDNVMQGKCKYLTGKSSTESMESCKSFWSVESCQSGLYNTKKNFMLQLTERTRCIIEQTHKVSSFKLANHPLDRIDMNITIKGNEETNICSFPSVKQRRNSTENVDACLRWINGNMIQGKDFDRPSYLHCQPEEYALSDMSSIFESYHSISSKPSSADTYTTAHTEQSNASTTFRFNKFVDVSSQIATQYYHIAFVQNDFQLNSDRSGNLETIYGDFAEDLSQKIMYDMYISVQEHEDVKVVEDYVQNTMNLAYRAILESYNEFEIKYDIRIENAEEHFSKQHRSIAKLDPEGECGSQVENIKESPNQLTQIDLFELQGQNKSVENGEEMMNESISGTLNMPGQVLSHDSMICLPMENSVKNLEEFVIGQQSVARETSEIITDSFIEQDPCLMRNNLDMMLEEDLLRYVSFRSGSSYHYSESLDKNVNLDEVANFVDDVLKSATNVIRHENCSFGEHENQSTVTLETNDFGFVIEQDMPKNDPEKNSGNNDDREQEGSENSDTKEKSQKILQIEESINRIVSNITEEREKHNELHIVLDSLASRHAEKERSSSPVLLNTGHHVHSIKEMETNNDGKTNINSDHDCYMDTILDDKERPSEKKETVIGIALTHATNLESTQYYNAKIIDDDIKMDAFVSSAALCFTTNDKKALAENKSSKKILNDENINVTHEVQTTDSGLPFDADGPLMTSVVQVFQNRRTKCNTDKSYSKDMESLYRSPLCNTPRPPLPYTHNVEYDQKLLQQSMHVPETTTLNGVYSEASDATTSDTDHNIPEKVIDAKFNTSVQHNQYQKCLNHLYCQRKKMPKKMGSHQEDKPQDQSRVLSSVTQCYCTKKECTLNTACFPVRPQQKKHVWQKSKIWKDSKSNKN